MAGIILALHPEQLQSWLDKRKSAATVFTRMRLKKSESLFSEPQFSTWIRYVDDLDKLSKEEVSAVSILIAHYGDEILYEMILKAKEVAGIERLAARLQAEQMKHWIINRKNPDEVYELFHLHWPLLSSVLINPNFPAWVKYVDDLNAKHPEAHISTISTLRKQRDLNDPILVHLIGEAKAVEGFKSAATKVEDGLIDAWLNAAKSPDNALAELGFSTATYNILGNPALDTWIKYTDAFNRKYPDKGTTMFETFVRMYGEDKLALMVTAAKKNENTDDIARELESALLKKWLSSGKTIDDVYWILRLYLSRYDFSDRSNLSIWVSYLNTVVTDNPSKVSEVFTYLKKNSETHKALLRILAIARKFPKLESAAAKLQMETLQQIFASGISPDKVFRLLGFDIGHNILSKPLFKEWMDYAIGFYKENTKKQESWFKVLRTYYADVDITSMINKAMQNPSTVEIVRKTESAWIKHHLDAQTTPAKMFAMFRLHGAGHETLASTEFAKWVSYLNEFNKRYPHQKETIIEGLRANYIDRVLVPLLSSAKQNSRTEKLAAKLQDDLINHWLAAKLEPATLVSNLGKVESADEMIQRFGKKLTEMPGNTS